MNKLAKTFDPNTIAAIEFLAGDDTNAVLAVWFRMLALAARDPEGCVRLTPGLTMTVSELADYFHCPTETVEATVQIMEQLQQLTRTEDDSLQLPACTATNRRSKAKKSVAYNTDATGATEKETEKEKRKEAKEKSKENNKKADIAAAISTAQRRPETETQNTVTTPATQNQSIPTVETAEPAKPPRSKNTRLIPAEQLPEPVQNILNVWNGLPLDNKFQGLYPAMLKRMEALLEQYGEEALQKAVHNVANSQFLLGHSRNNRGWAITLGWMLNPDHLENILQGKYQDKKPRGDSLLFQPGDEQAPYSNGFYGTVVD